MTRYVTNLADSVTIPYEVGVVGIQLELWSTEAIGTVHNNSAGHMAIIIQIQQQKGYIYTE